MSYSTYSKSGETEKYFKKIIIIIIDKSERETLKLKYFPKKQNVTLSRTKKVYTNIIRKSG